MLIRQVSKSIFANTFYLHWWCNQTKSWDCQQFNWSLFVFRTSAGEACCQLNRVLHLHWVLPTLMQKQLIHERNFLRKKALRMFAFICGNSTIKMPMKTQHVLLWLIDPAITVLLQMVFMTITLIISHCARTIFVVNGVILHPWEMLKMQTQLVGLTKVLKD